MTEQSDPTADQYFWRLCVKKFPGRFMLIVACSAMIGYGVHALTGLGHPVADAVDRADRDQDFPGFVIVQRDYIITTLKKVAVPRDDGKAGMTVLLKELDREMGYSLSRAGVDLGREVFLHDAIRSVNDHYDEVLAWGDLSTEAEIDAAAVALRERAEKLDYWVWFQHLVGQFKGHAKMNLTR